TQKCGAILHHNGRKVVGRVIDVWSVILNLLDSLQLLFGRVFQGRRAFHHDHIQFFTSHSSGVRQKPQVGLFRAVGERPLISLPIHLLSGPIFDKPQVHPLSRPYVH
ncbi:unnamed protein product, partial [Ectocarpus sp. 12 AP-2014]